MWWGWTPRPGTTCRQPHVDLTCSRQAHHELLLACFQLLGVGPLVASKTPWLLPALEHSATCCLQSSLRLLLGHMTCIRPRQADNVPISCNFCLTVPGVSGTHAAAAPLLRVRHSRFCRCFMAQHAAMCGTHSTCNHWHTCVFWLLTSHVLCLYTPYEPGLPYTVTHRLALRSCICV